MDGRRKQRVAELIKSKVGQFLITDIAAQLPAMVTVMRVEMSDDLKYAKIFVSIFGDDEKRQKSLNVLKREVRNIRKQVGGTLRLRHIPFLTFIEDKSLDHAFKIEGMLKKIQGDEDGEQSPENM